jgi:NADPH-dependent 2,4-dienoyl-CoA reductase/sulfur reductase-like enzyme
MSGEPLSPGAHVVVVGASLAGARATEALRSGGFTGRVTLVGDETHPPYDRPPLSKQFLSGEWDRHQIDLPVEQLSSAEPLLGRTAVRLDANGKVVTLADGSQLTYDGLIVATGVRARTLDHLLAAPSDQVYTLRTVDDCRDLQRGLRGHVIIIGAGFIGTEVASTALALDAKVTVIEPLGGPLLRILGQHGSTWIADRMQNAGVAFRLGVGVTALTPTYGDDIEVTLSDDSAIVGDAVVVAIGATPNTEWLLGSGLTIDDGLVCDDALFAADNVVAAGDVARWYRQDLGRTVRLEHWTNAVKQAECAAHNLIRGRQAARPYIDLPYVWSDQFGMRIEVLGLPSADHTATVVWGSPDDLRFLISYRDGGELTGVVGVNATRRLLTLRRHVAGASWLDNETLTAAIS